MKSFLQICFFTILFSACQSDPKEPATQALPGQETPAPAAADTPAKKEKEKPLCFRPVKSEVEKGLKAHLGADLEKIPLDDKYFSYAEFDLNRDGKKEYFVALTSPYFCGSGGCSGLILNSDFTVNSELSVLEYPIFVSNIFLSNGWYDIFAKSGDTFHRLTYDGTKYPGNPSIAPELDMAFYPEKTSLLSYAYILKCRY
ncbi:MAG: hypothetical protein AAFZ15_34315 [Bacteroidota bacterium]